MAPPPGMRKRGQAFTVHGRGGLAKDFKGARKKEPVQNEHADAGFEQQTEKGAAAILDEDAIVEQKPLLPEFESAEMRHLAETLLGDIIDRSPCVEWERIKGLDHAKSLLEEAILWPIKFPEYFTGVLQPWKGILLFGPPGTGKTMLAKAVATECKTTFFNISASSIVSKWRGDSEKLVKVLFELARHHAPSTIFFDDIDAIISHGGGREHEASRCLKIELLIQMDGLTKTKDLVFVLAATNLPWELDSSMLRRLEKRILVPLPKAEARRAMFRELLPSDIPEREVLYNLLVEKTEGYSGSDIHLVCRDVLMQPVRRAVSSVLEAKDRVGPKEERPKQVGPLEREDMVHALRHTKPSAHLHSHRFEKFNQDYGSHQLVVPRSYFRSRRRNKISWRNILLMLKPYCWARRRDLNFSCQFNVSRSKVY